MNTRKEVRKRRVAGALAAALAGAVLLGTAATEARAQLRRGGLGGYGSSRQQNDLRASVDTGRTQYPSGRDVEITLRLTNRSDRSFEVALNDYEYDVIIREARTGSTVWQWSRQSRGARRDRRTVQWDPRQTRTWRVLWDQTDANGRQVRAGAYRIEARLYPQDVVSTEVVLTGDNDDRDGNNGRGPFPGGRIPRPFPAPSTDDDRYGGGWGGNGRYNDLRGDLSGGDGTVRAGDTVTLTYAVRNNTGRRLTLRFPTSQQYDVTVRSTRGRTVWRLSDERSYGQGQSEMTLDAGERHTYTFRWRVDRDLEDGRYELVAFLTPRGADRDGVATTRTFVRVEGRYGRGQDRDDFSVRLRDLLDDGRASIGRRVRVSGTYGGARPGRGRLPGNSNEWVLRSEDRGLYVRGGLPRSARDGESVTVTGTLRRGSDGQLYLEAD